MHTGENSVLARIELGTIKAGAYWHVYPAAYPATASNPNSKARLAWRDGHHGMFYAGDTAAAALWETALRFAEVRKGSVYTDHQHLQNWMLARLTLKQDVSVIDLRPPHRRAVVDAHSDLDAMWDVALKTPHHEETHGVAARLMSQLVGAGYDAGTALRWHSRQAGTESVILFFEPPMEAAWWAYGDQDIYRLDEPEGQEQIRIALSTQGLAWIGSPSGAGFGLPPEDTLQAEKLPAGRKAK
ncbi:RES domain-containing protein [Paraburkholderia sp. XV]|uniref:RES domain-containing protein n=1 Tax=Paraburkholderia sp. XV TaxID=2831520 RepID=UPI001CD7C9D7|nr:RES domain-containing protein [Paraburkholderia sp. XV]